MNIKTILLPFFCFWSLCILGLLFKSGLSRLWKISIACIFTFYLFLFWPELSLSWKSYSANFFWNLGKFLETLFSLFPLFLFLAWPFVLYNSLKSPRKSSSLRKMALLTLIYWMFSLGSIYFKVPFLKKLSIQKIIHELRSIKIPKPLPK